MDKEFLLSKEYSREENTRVLFYKYCVSVIGYNQLTSDAEGKKTAPNNLKGRSVVPLHAQIPENLKTLQSVPPFRNTVR